VRASGIGVGRGALIRLGQGASKRRSRFPGTKVGRSSSPGRTLRRGGQGGRRSGRRSDEPPLAALPTAEDATLREPNAAKKDWISRNGAQERSFKSGYRPRTADSRASKTDPEANPMTWAKKRAASSATRLTT
jgi:hypothetical protein